MNEFGLSLESKSGVARSPFGQAQLVEFGMIGMSSMIRVESGSLLVPMMWRTRQARNSRNLEGEWKKKTLHFGVKN